MPFNANITDSDLSGFPATLTYNEDNTVATQTVTVTNLDQTTEQYRQTYTWSGGVLVTISAWVQL